ncbi:hypothetical protein BCV70DRAFT_77849 [Testicularia cyperi]|uniref:DDHD domain-containing protein n=1 Tax=Testicularia cyperi TaxID=1882483 RepID=A0A317XTL8_9BASI|nr:hypothetical protein BCV70DRAFT_77849 [Testicularia cyperi]
MDESCSDPLLRPPPQRARWMYARGKTWAIFSPHDDEKLETRWRQLGGDAWRRSLNQAKQRDSDDPQVSSSTSHSAPSSLATPPSGVEAIRSALTKFSELPDTARAATYSSRSGATSSPGAHASSWSAPLRKLKRAFVADPQQEQHGQDRQHSDIESDHDAKEECRRDSDEKVQVNHVLDPDEPEENRRTKVEVMEDNLFDVDLESMTLYPVFWKGVLLKVVRATWFYSSLTDGSYAPISADDPLSQDLDRAYKYAKPWRATRVGNNQPAADNDPDEADSSKFWALSSMSDKGQVCFEDAEVGRIFSEDLRGRFLSVLGGSIVVRGFDRAEQIARDRSFNPLFNIPSPWATDDEQKVEASSGSGSERDSLDVSKNKSQGSSLGAKSASRRVGAARTGGSPPSGGGSDGPHHAKSSTEGEDDDHRSFAAKLVPSSDAALRPIIAFKKLLGYDKSDAADEEKRRLKQKTTEDELDRQRETSDHADQLPNDRKDDPVELVFAVHGIGQQLTEDFEALDFVYDVEHLRNIAATNAQDPVIRRLSRGRRAQFLPICWRRFVEFDDEPEENDNFYTLNDITNSAAIPMVRNVISKVVLDVPFYLSRHRKRMINSVISELNRTYRLFCRRNPEFESKGGRVSIIGHSLGSALAADILSVQPSRVPPLAEMQESRSSELKANQHLHFNVKHLFFIGSPVAFFFYLDGGQLIARRGTQRHPDSDEDTLTDAVSDAQGKYGCLAAETVYNIFNPNDPVAFQLSPTVDAAYAGLVKPIPIENATEALLRSLTLPRMSVTKVFEKYGQRPFQGVGKIVRQARLLADERKELPDNLTGEENKEIEARRLGHHILAKSDYIQKVRKMHELDTARESSHNQDKSSSESHKSKVTVELGSRKKEMQPELALRDAQERGILWDPDFRLDLDTLERAERRFRALNPHGCIDFHLSANISLSGYLDMFSAHLAYWTHPDFANFVLTQLFMDFNAATPLTLVPEVAIPRSPSDGNDTTYDASAADTDEE